MRECVKDVIDFRGYLNVGAFICGHGAVTSFHMWVILVRLCNIDEPLCLFQSHRWINDVSLHVNEGHTQLCEIGSEPMRGAQDSMSLEGNPVEDFPTFLRWEMYTCLEQCKHQFIIVWTHFGKYLIHISKCEWNYVIIEWPWLSTYLWWYPWMSCTFMVRLWYDDIWRWCIGRIKYLMHCCVAACLCS